MTLLPKSPLLGCGLFKKELSMVSIRYLVKDVDASVAFYTNSLGFELKQQFGPAMAITQKGNLTLWLAGPPSSAAQAMPDGRKPEPGGWNRFVLQVEDLSGLVAKLKSQGVAFRNEILKGPGGSQILCEDPSGNVIELFQPLN
jgi:catechol 2,3-dioxygenase-like lactoylglutathione lyase family enzyme